jgi:parvulin-like peptidyl-prolyl isomerase
MITDLRAKIVAGADFAAVAKESSDDTGSGANGGDLGSFGRGQMVPEFDKEAFLLPVGELSQPVKSPFGYHLIKVESHVTKSLDEAKPDIEKKLRPEIARNEVEQLRKSATVLMDDGFFGPAPAALPGRLGAVPAPPPPPPAAK